MDNFFTRFTRSVVSYRLESCCCFAPLRAGLLCIGYFNVFLALLLIIGTATASFVTIIQRVQEGIMDEASMASCIFVPSCDLAFNVVLLCALHRKDVVLLRFYMYYVLAEIVVLVIVYSMVIATITVLYMVVIAINTLYQAYVIILVRSAILELKERKFNEQNNGHLTELHVRPKSPDVETPDISEKPDSPEPVRKEPKVEIVKDEKAEVVEEKAEAVEKKAEAVEEQAEAVEDQEEKRKDIGPPKNSDL